jgi:hypothetical protein
MICCDLYTLKQGTALMARLMSAVRNSNTRASHTSMDMNGINGDGKGGSGAAGGNIDHFSESPDRRSSFSYLRRASERRRRLRMKDRQEGEDSLGGGQDSLQRDGARNNQEDDEDEQMERGMRRDSGTTNEPRLRRSQQIYDEEGEHEEDEMAAMMMDQDSGEYGARAHRAQSQHHQSQQQESQRRQSINDRLTDAVTDVMEFVREESFKRGKRHSLHRRRQMAASGSAGAHSGSTYTIGASHGMEGDMDSDSARYRRRRVMRRSPRRSTTAHHQRQSYMNDSDTGSMASMVQDHNVNAGRMTNFDMQQQRLNLQQHGGSVQDSQGFYGSEGGRAQMMQQHRRHQSADAYDIMNEPLQRYSRHQHHTHGSGYISELEGHMMSRSVKASEDEEHNEPSNVSSSIIRPIQVGQSPPPALIGRTDVELMATARRKRDAEDLGTLADNDDETAIHLGTDSGNEKQDDGQVRFIAPSVAPLSSPSALTMPDEEIVPPDVPYRGRRLPQIPGSSIIRSAADFLHSSFYGRPQQHGPILPGSVANTMASTTSNIAATPLVGGSRYNPDYPPATSVVSGPDLMRQPGEPIFPSVSESPTSKIEAPVPPPTQASIIKRQATIDQQVGTSSSLDGSGSINFPRVSFSPTHGIMKAPGVASTSTPSYHSAMIATQSTAGTQSTVLAPMSSTQAETMLPDRLAWTRGRLVKKEEKDDWF